MGRHLNTQIDEGVLVDLYTNGMTYQEISNKYGIASETVRRKVILHGGISRKPARRSTVAPWIKGKHWSNKTRMSHEARIATMRGRKWHHTQHSRQKISLAMKRIGAGGYKPGSGRGIKGVCFGVWCDSSWEAAFVIWAKWNGLKIKRNKIRLPMNGTSHSAYIPDFIIDGTMVEIKGFYRVNDYEKCKQHPQVYWCSEDAMDVILRMVKNTKEFVSFCSNKRPKIKNQLEFFFGSVAELKGPSLEN